MRKPTRRVRRFVKRRFGGKARGKGRSRFGFLAEMADVTYDSTFFGGKGHSKGCRRSSRFGRGRRGNPKGADGTIVKCHTCGSEDHLKANCTPGGGGGSMLMFGLMSNAYRSVLAAGPLGDLLGPRTTQNMMTNESADSAAAAPPPEPRLDGIWEQTGQATYMPFCSEITAPPPFRFPDKETEGSARPTMDTEQLAVARNYASTEPLPGSRDYAPPGQAAGTMWEEVMGNPPTPVRENVAAPDPWQNVQDPWESIQMPVPGTGRANTPNTLWDAWNHAWQNSLVRRKTGKGKDKGQSSSSTATPTPVLPAPPSP